MTTLQKLREQTAPYHQSIESNPLLKKLMSNLSLADYIKILEKFYGFYLPFENSLKWEEIEFSLNSEFLLDRRKAPLLEKDLNYFAVPLNHIPLSQSYPRPPSLPALLGCFYVLEGSCLGRKMMWPRLSKKLGLSEKAGGVFFYDCGDQLQNTWKNFCDLLVANTKNQSEEQECILAAIQTFEKMDQWFKE